MEAFEGASLNYDIDTMTLNKSFSRDLPTPYGEYESKPSDKEIRIVKFNGFELLLHCDDKKKMWIDVTTLLGHLTSCENINSMKFDAKLDTLRKHIKKSKISFFDIPLTGIRKELFISTFVKVSDLPIVFSDYETMLIKFMMKELKPSSKKSMDDW